MSEKRDSYLESMELKDRKMTWMTCQVSSSEIISALIKAGIYKPQGVDDSFAELKAQTNMLLEEFDKLFGSDDKDTKTSKDGVVGRCIKCGSVIPENVLKYSLKFFGKQLCYDCQPKQPSGE